MSFAGPIEKVTTILVPSIAVVTFDCDECPEGWKPYRPAFGHTIIGAGKGEKLTERRLHEIGGEERHAMTVNELVKHEHPVYGTDHTQTPQHADSSHNEYGRFCVVLGVRQALLVVACLSMSCNHMSR